MNLHDGNDQKDTFSRPGTQAWHQVRLEFTASEGVSKATIILGADRDLKGRVWFDDLELKRTGP